MSALHADALAVLGTWKAPDGQQERHRARIHAHLRAHGDGLRRECFPDHVTAGTLVLSHDGNEVLLNLHRKAGRWFAFGGHCEPTDATLAGVALREALEESGLTEVGFDRVPVQLDEHAVPFCDPRGTVNHLDVRYVAVAPSSAVHAASAESLDVRWWPVDALPDELEDDMRALVALSRERVAQPSSSLGGGSIDFAAE